MGIDKGRSMRLAIFLHLRLKAASDIMSDKMHACCDCKYPVAYFMFRSSFTTTGAGLTLSAGIWIVIGLGEKGVAVIFGALRRACCTDK